jgi:DNA polymerase I-like protein with 3'-5' exonuclease and polymerase domains
MKDHIQKDIDRALANARQEWKERYYELAYEFLEAHEIFEGGELKAYCKMQGLEDPHSHNVWGSMVQSLARTKGWTVKIGEVEPTTAHTHIDRVGQWRSLLCDPSLALAADDGPGNAPDDTLDAMLDDLHTWSGKSAPAPPPYEIITTPEGLEDMLDRAGEIAALDFEGWNFFCRLAQICNDNVWAVIDFGPEDGHNWFYDVAHWFEEHAWIAFNSKHEKRVFARYDAYPTVWDVANLRRAIRGGGHMSLKQLVGWELTDDDGDPIVLDKAEQASDWNRGELSRSQLDYAADDAKWTWAVWKKLRAEADAEQMQCFDMLDAMTDAVIEMEDTGLTVDPVHHEGLIQNWQQLNDEREEKLRELITEEEVANLNSGKQLNDFFAKILPDDILDDWPRTEKTGQLSTANKDLLNMAGVFGGTPFGDALRLLAERTTLQKYLSSFGQTLLNKARMANDMRIHASYNIGAAITCRFSSSGPNLQQIPRDRDFFGERLSVRKSFVADADRLLVSLDYSGIEMRVLALVSGDEQLLHDVVYGDPHAVMAEYVVGRPIDKSKTEDKELRQSMKAVNFGIVYGTTALGLAGRQGWTFSFAEDLLKYWAGRYPKAWDMRFDAQREAKNTGRLRMIDGGTIEMGKRPGLTRCANYPVQRAALSVMARAIIRHKDTLDAYRDEIGDWGVAKMASTIHDALIDDAAEEHALATLKMMKDDMVAGYLDVFPDAPTDGLVEGGTGPSWGELEEHEV